MSKKTNIPHAVFRAARDMIAALLPEIQSSMDRLCDIAPPRERWQVPWTGVANSTNILGRSRRILLFANRRDFQCPAPNHLPMLLTRLHQIN